MNSSAAPETIASTLLSDLHNALSSGKFTELELVRWERDAQKLINASRGHGLEAKAQIAALHADDNECDRVYSLALKSTDDYVGAVIRYMAVLAQRLRQEKLLEVYRSTGAALQGNPNACRYVEGMLATEGFLPSAWALGEQLKSMGSFSAASENSESELATQRVQADWLTDEACGAPVTFAKRFLRGKAVNIKSVSVSPSVHEDGSAAIFVTVSVDQSPDEAAHTEFELFEALDSQAFTLECDGKVSIALVGARAELS